MKNIQLLLLIAILGLQSCIADDFVDDFVQPQIRVSQPPSTIAAGEAYQLEITFFNNVGQEQDVPLEFTSAALSIFTVDDKGLITGLSEGTGELTITASFEEESYSEILTIEIAGETVVGTETRSGTIATTSSYALSGAFTIEKTATGIKINIGDDYSASTALPGLYVYLTNNKNTSVGALEIGPVAVFEGAHSYEIDNIGLDDHSHILYFCKPFSVKVGDGAIE